MFLIYFVCQYPSHCRALSANLPPIVAHYELWAKYLWVKLSLAHSCSLSGFLTGSIFHCNYRSFRLAHSDLLWPSLALHGSLWLALALSLSFSVAHRLTMSLLGSFSHCPSLSCPDMMSTRRKGACKMLPFCFFLWLCSNKQFHRAVVRIGKQGRDWRTCKQAISPLTIPLGTSTCSANDNIH